MANFTSADVMKLREQTGVGMMDCKRLSLLPTVTSTKQSSSFAKRVWQAPLRSKAVLPLKVL